MGSNRKEKDRKTALPKVTDSLPEGFSLISDEKLIALYANLLKCRMVEQRLANGGGRVTVASCSSYAAQNQD